MHGDNTVIGVIVLRNNKVSYPVIRRRYGIGNHSHASRKHSQ